MQMHEEYLDLLKKSAILSVVPEQELLALTRHIQLRQFSEGEVIIRQGEPGDGVYVITKGAAAVTTEGRSSPGQATLGVFGPGEAFGEMALLDNHPRSATVIAIASTSCAFLPAAAFSEILQRNPSIALSLLPILTQRLREADRWIQSLL